MVGRSFTLGLRWRKRSVGPGPRSRALKRKTVIDAPRREDHLPFATGVGRRVKGAAVSDRRKPSRNEQRRARALAAERGISYMQALNVIRSETRSTGSTLLAIFIEQCENILGRRGIIGGVYSQRPSRARVVADAFSQAQGLLASRVRELAPGEPTAPVADAAKMLAGAALAAADPLNEIVTPQQLAELVRESPSQIPWAELPASRPDADRVLEDTGEWWSRVRGTLPEVDDLERADDHALRVLLRLVTEYAFWSETGVADIP